MIAFRDRYRHRREELEEWLLLQPGEVEMCMSATDVERTFVVAAISLHREDVRKGDAVLEDPERLARKLFKFIDQRCLTVGSGRALRMKALLKAHLRRVDLARWDREIPSERPVVDVMLPTKHARAWDRVHVSVLHPMQYAPGQATYATVRAAVSRYLVGEGDDRPRQPYDVRTWDEDCTIRLEEGGYMLDWHHGSALGVRANWPTFHTRTMTTENWRSQHRLGVPGFSGGPTDWNVVFTWKSMVSRESELLEDSAGFCREADATLAHVCAFIGALAEEHTDGGFARAAIEAQLAESPTTAAVSRKPLDWSELTQSAPA